jgi:hypothetical protein
MSNQKDTQVAKAPVGRVRRKSLTNKGKLSVALKDENYEYRFVNDDGDNVADKIAAGWDPVLRSETVVGDSRVDSAASEGSIQQISVGQGKKAILMKIQKDWYDDDQLEKQKLIDKTEAATKADALSGSDYGKVEISRK